METGNILEINIFFSYFLIFLLCIVMFFSKKIVFYFFFLFSITNVFFYSYGVFFFFLDFNSKHTYYSSLSSRLDITMSFYILICTKSFRELS
jgi:hypothetical protein